MKFDEVRVRIKNFFGASMALVPVIAVCLALHATQLPPSAQPSQQEKEMQDRMMKEANKKRQQDIRDDTTKLFELATELKAAVEKSNENMLSLDVVRKADEVEKLAKRVKEKMKESIGPPSNSPPTVQLPGFQRPPHN